MKSTIRLFKAVLIKKEGTKENNKNILDKTIPYGFILSPEVVFNYSENELNNIINVVKKELIISGEQMNASFHKSWEKVANVSIEQLVLEQLVHYFTTYGFEALGIYNEESVYVPSEKLEIPEIDVEGFRFIIIKGYTKDELKTKLNTFLNSGIALKEETMNDVLDVATYLEINEKDIKTVKNREIKTKLYDYFNLFPENPIEFLQYCIYKATNQTLLIKNRETVSKIKINDNLNILSLFSRYKQHYGFERLAEIFYRFKPIFLAFRTNSMLKVHMNRIRRLAKRYHDPMKLDFLNNVTSEIKKYNTLDIIELETELSKVNTFRKIRLAYALKYRTQYHDSILYQIRNGKGYATDFSQYTTIFYEEVLSIVLDSIIEDIKHNVKGKKIYIPDFMNYALPSTEKQFVGNFPSGSFVSIPHDMIVGIHWENVNHDRIDLDLSMISPTSKIGWDRLYRTNDRTILFSGDMTDAPTPKGTSESFYIRKQVPNSFIMFVNYFNFNSDVKVPFKIFVAKEQAKVDIQDFVDRPSRNFMVNPNNILFSIPTSIDKKQKIIGLLTVQPNESRFHFVETSIGNSITSRNTTYNNHAQKYLQDFYSNPISLNDLLQKAGAVIVPNQNDADIDLSVEKIEKDTVLKLFQK